MLIPEDLPSARVRASWWRRLVVGPEIALSSKPAWALTLATAATVVQAAWFALVSGLGPIVIIAIVLTAMIQWMITAGAMWGVAQLAPLLARQSRGSGRAVGAIVTALAACTIERIAAGSYVTWFEGLARGSFWLAAAVVGAIWGLWLPEVTTAPTTE